jgi:hypothetical protein
MAQTAVPSISATTEAQRATGMDQRSAPITTNSEDLFSVPKSGWFWRSYSTFSGWFWGFEWPLTTKDWSAAKAQSSRQKALALFPKHQSRLTGEAT